MKYISITLTVDILLKALSTNTVLFVNRGPYLCLGGAA